MQKRFKQMPLLDTYKSVEEQLDKDKPDIFRLLDEHLDWDEIIPETFYRADTFRSGIEGIGRAYRCSGYVRAEIDILGASS